MQTLPKPCPKCNGKAKCIMGRPNMGNSKHRYALVQCQTCFHKTPTLKPFPGEKDKAFRIRAIELWNSEDF